MVELKEEPPCRIWVLQRPAFSQRWDDTPEQKRTSWSVISPAYQLQRIELLSLHLELRRINISLENGTSHTQAGGLHVKRTRKR